MRALILLLFFCFCSKADWMSDQVFYFWNNVHPGVALTTNTIQGIDHASGSVTSVQIGDQNGTNGAYCTTFISDGVCGGSVRNCTWGHITNNMVIDAYLFSTCRPLTNGITTVVTNLAPGTALKIFSVLTHTWNNSTLLVNYESIGFTTDFDDGSTGFFYGLTCTTGGMSTSGNSGSAVFTSDGVFVGDLSGMDGSDFFIMALYPNGVQYGSPTPPVPTSPGVSGLSALFNSDPDR